MGSINATCCGQDGNFTVMRATGLSPAAKRGNSHGMDAIGYLKIGLGWLSGTGDLHKQHA
jgi:hypothetical protein